MPPSRNGKESEVKMEEHARSEEEHTNAIEELNKAMEEKTSTLKHNQILELVPSFQDIKAISCKWVYKVKTI